MKLYLITIARNYMPLTRFSIEAMSLDEASDRVANMECSEGCTWFKVEEQE